MPCGRWLARAALLLAGWALCGCALWRPTTVPVPQQAFPSRCTDAAGPRPLLVLLPGRFMPIDELHEHGFVDAVQRRGLDVDVLLVDAHLGYYRDRSVLRRLHEDVMVPARRRGVTQVWLAGISLGGLGALLYDDEYPGEVSGLVLLAPYLGEPPMADAVRRAGGLRLWTAAPRSTDRPADGPDQRAWRRLQEITAAAQPPLYLGYGQADDFAPALRLLAAALPPEQVTAPPGGHDWPAWLLAWQSLLDRLPLPHRPDCAVRAPVPCRSC